MFGRGYLPAHGFLFMKGKLIDAEKEKIYSFGGCRILKIQFPGEFSFGAATSGPQTEGASDKKTDSIWDYWYRTQPEAFHNKVGNDPACNTYYEYMQDVELMEACKLNSFRTSIQWSRIFKDPTKLSINEEGVSFYRNYFKAIKEANIDLYVNLFHFDLPFVLEEEYGGWLSDRIVDLYVEFAKVCFQLFDEYVDKWITFNEPIAFSRSAYFYNDIYPCHKSTQAYVTANNNILKAHMLAVSFYKKNFCKEIGIVMDLLPPIISSEEDQYAGLVYDVFFNKIFLDPCIKLEYNRDYLKILEKHEIDIHQITEFHSIDFVGINYYQPVYVKKQSEYRESEFFPWYYFDTYIPEGVRINEYRGWAIEPIVVYDIAKTIQNEYGNIKWYLSENGMGVENEENFLKDGIIQDDYRTDFIKEHLYYLAKAVSEGSNCFGYHLWTFIDCFSWKNSFKNRYGLVSLNLHTREKKLKKNAVFYRDLAVNKFFIGPSYE